MRQSPSRYAVDPERPRNPWIPDLSCYVFAVILLKCVIDFFVSYDTYWHVRMGEWIWTHREVPTAEPGFALQDAPLAWIDHEWLAQVVLYPLWRLGGFLGLRVILALIPALIFQWTYRRLRVLGTAPLPALGLVAVAATATAHHWFARPHLLAWVCLLASLHLWSRIRSGRWVAGAVLVLMHVLWVNLHGTFLLQFVFGFVFLVAALARREASPATRREPSRILGLVLLLVAVSLLNPYGWRLFIAPAPFLEPLEIRILEWEPFGPTDLSFYAFLGYGVLLGWALWRDRRRVLLYELLLSGVLLLLATMASRHVPLFVLATLPSLVGHGSEACRTGGGRRHVPGGFDPLSIRSGLRWANDAVTRWERRHSGRYLLGLVWGMLLVLGVTSTTGPLAGQVWDGIDRGKTPVQAGEFLEREKISGRIFTDYGWAGYFVFRLGPGSQVFIDGRAEMYGPTRMRHYRAVVKGESGWREILRRHRVEIIVHHTGSALTERLRRDGEWVTVYSDPQATVFLRSTALPIRMWPARDSSNGTFVRAGCAGWVQGQGLESGRGSSELSRPGSDST